MQASPGHLAKPLDYKCVRNLTLNDNLSPVHLHDSDPNFIPKAGAVSASSQIWFLTYFLQPFPSLKVAQIKIYGIQTPNQVRVWTQSQISTVQCCPISAEHFQLPFYTCYSTFNFILPGTERALTSDASIKASLSYVGIGPNSQPIALVFTTPELFLFITGINEYWIKHGVVVCLTSNVLAQCPLCITHTLSSYLWKKTKDWHFFFPINPGSEMSCDSSPSESQESFHGQQSNVIMTVG